jgi:hypothetical protein
LLDPVSKNKKRERNSGKKHADTCNKKEYAYTKFACKNIDNKKYI